jgi:hypothetical protein
MKRRCALIIALLALSGCGHNLYFMGRTTSKIGHARIVAPGTHSGDITVDIAGTKYVGRWLHMMSGGAVSFGTATAFSGGRTATAMGSFSAVPAQGNGSIIASADDGTQLRCAFDFNALSQSGMGVCQDSRNEVYDLQID